MAVVYPKEKIPSYKSWVDVALSTAADGVTGADIADITGYSISGIQPGTLASTTCTYTVKGAIDGSSSIGLMYNSTGTPWVFGSTSIDPRLAVFSPDPAFFCGVRFVQLVSNTSTGVTPNAAGAIARIWVSAFGTVK